jgi:hypothetical protein
MWPYTGDINLGHIVLRLKARDIMASRTSFVFRWEEERGESGLMGLLATPSFNSPRPKQTDMSRILIMVLLTVVQIIIGRCHFACENPYCTSIIKKFSLFVYFFVTTKIFSYY